MLHCFDYQAHAKRLIPMQKQPTYECRIPDISSLGGLYVHLHVNFSEMLAHSCFFASTSTLRPVEKNFSFTDHSQM